MTDICRLCASLKTLDQLQTIEDPTLSVKQKLSRCCQFEFPAEDDFLPQSVCNDCILCLNNSWAFSEKVLQAQETLKRAFLIDYDTNEALLKNEIMVLEQQQHQEHHQQHHQQSTHPHQQPYEEQAQSHEIDYIDTNQFSRRKNKQPIRVTLNNDQESTSSIEKAPEKKMHELSFKIRSIIISLHTKGYSNQQISSKLNIPEQAITEWIFTYQSHAQHDSTSINQSISFKNELNDTIIEIPTQASTDHQSIIVETVPIQDIPQHSVDQMDLKKDPEIYEVSNQLEYQGITTTVDASSQEQDTVNNLAVYSNNFSDNDNNDDDDDDDDVDDDDDDDDDEMDDDDEDTNETESQPDNYEDGTELLGLCETDKNSDGTITANGLEKMNQSTWNDYPWDCSECGIRSGSLIDFKEHYQTHHDSSIRYLCVDCSKTFEQFTSFIVHVHKNHRPYLKYCCEKCSKYFWNTNSFREHQRQNCGKLKFLCQECGKSFRSASTLNGHSRCHLPVDIKNTYNCDICFKKFGTKPNLSAHKRIHAGVRDFTCDQCGKSFVQKGNLDNHLLTHMANKPFTCTICRKSFKTQLRLFRHTSVHTGFKPHKCDDCGREFREKGTLREHIRIHTGAMPFTCEYCGKKFRFKGVLTTHRRQHTGERPYSCVECNHHFTNWPNYNKHMKRRHGINTSVTVRKPQAIPPSGMPAKAKLNHVVPTVHNLGLVQPSIPPDTTNQIENNEILETICEKDIITVDEPEGKFVTTTVVPTVVNASTTQTVGVADIPNHQQILSHDLSDTCQATQITVLAHPAIRPTHQVLNSQTHNLTPTTQYSYISAAGYIYNLPSVDIDLMQSANLQR